MTAAERIYQRFLRRIQQAEDGWRESEIIPAELPLAESEGVSRTTLRVALKRLTVDGWLIPAAGKRRMVSRPVAVVQHTERQPFLKEIGRLAMTLSNHTGSLPTLCRHSPALLEKLEQSSSSTTSWGETLKELGQSPDDVILDPPQRSPCYALASNSRIDVNEVMKSLNIEADTELYSMLRLRRAKGTPLALQWCVVSSRPFGGKEISICNEDIVPGGLTAAYSRFGIERHFATVSFRSCCASEDECEWLNVESHSPLIEERRVSYMLRKAGRSQQLWPYEFLITLYTDRIQLHSAWSELSESK